jgi:hypothetical protein
VEQGGRDGARDNVGACVLDRACAGGRRQACERGDTPRAPVARAKDALAGFSECAHADGLRGHVGRRATNGGQDMESAVSDAAGGNTRPLRVAIMAGSALALVGVAAVLVSAGVSGSRANELMYGGPLSFDMVHTHILNMKMRRSRLKEKLKQAALERKDRELAQEHGFSQGSMVRPRRPRVMFRGCERAVPSAAALGLGAALRLHLHSPVVRCGTDGLCPRRAERPRCSACSAPAADDGSAAAADAAASNAAANVPAAAGVRPAVCSIPGSLTAARIRSA